MYNDGIRENASEYEINKQIATTFFRNEKAIREKHELTQDAMGECVGCTGMAISNWELGKHVPKNLDEIIQTVADLFDLDPAVLVTEDFADRYDPQAYETVNTVRYEPPEEPEKVEETEEEIAIRFMTNKYYQSVNRYVEYEKELYELAEKIEAYKQALKVFGITVEDTEALISN